MKALKVDGVFGQKTKKRMQKWLHVSQDGKIGVHTKKALQKRVKAKVDGVWGKNTTKALQKYLNARGASLEVDGAFGVNSKKALQTYLNAYYKLTPAPAPTPTPVQTTNSEKIAAMAEACAWPAGTAKSKYSYPDGKPTSAYKSALNKAYPKRSKWSDRPKKGASCDVFVGTVARASGVDTKFPRGLDGVVKHMKCNGKWELTGVKSKADMKRGDVVFQLYKGGGGHIFIYLGNGKIANAHYNGKTYGIIQKFSSAKEASKCKTYNVYRAK